LSAARQYDQTIEEDILMEKKDSYTPAAAKRAYDQLDQLVAARRSRPDKRVRIAGTLRAKCGSC